MNPSNSYRTGTAAALCVISLAQAGGITFEEIPGAFSANDMSPDGRYIVGETASDPYLLDTESDTMTMLVGGLAAIAVSDDGSVVLGNMTDPVENAQVAAIWAEADGWQSIGFLPNALSCPSKSSAYELSADGTVAVGLSWDGCNGRGFIWTEETGMQELEVLANGSNRASVVSADGAVIGGFAQGSFSRTPAIWSDDITGQLLDPPSGDALGEVHGISDDGTQLLVEWNGAAMIFDQELNPTTIGSGSLNPGWSGIPTDISNNGTVVGFDILGLSRIAWVQPGGAGPIQNLKTWAQAGGATVPTDLNVCQAISSDGMKMIGHTGPFFATAWIITIDAACPADLDGSGDVGFSDLLNLLAAWGQSGVAADLDGGGTVGFEDLLLLLNAWGPCTA